MNAKIVTVGDLSEFFKTLPPDTKIYVKEEDYRNRETSTRFVKLMQYGNTIKNIDGIEYRPEYKAIYFGI